jgi:hypothetical protein
MLSLRLAASRPAAFLFLVACLSSISAVATATEPRTHDPIVDEALSPVFGQLPPAKAAGVCVKSHNEFLYRRKPNWWAACLVPVGYLPLSFRIRVECRTRVSLETPTRKREFAVSSTCSRTVWGRAPNASRPARDLDFEQLERDARAQAAKRLATEIREWMRNDEP